jgi:pyridoxine/pyridoxamine 5'-phosphate oxidase
MAKGDPNIKDKGVKFSKEYQPSPEAKSAGKKRISDFKEAITFFGEQLKKQIQIDGEVIELTYHSNIAYQLLKKANEGDLKAIDILAKIEGWNAPTKAENVNNNYNQDITIEIG